MPISYLQRDGGRIAYEVWGDGPLAVCVPGMGDLRQVYRFTVLALVAAGYRVAAMDLRGHGDSDDGFDRYDDVAAGSDILALIEHLGGPAIVIGNSMGAGATVWAAAEDPSRMSGLVLVGPFVRDGASKLMVLLFRLALIKPWGPAVWNSYYPKFYPGRRPTDLDAHLTLIRKSLRRGSHWRSFVRTSHTSHTPASERLDRVQAPVLVVMGEKDPDWPDPVAEARFVSSALRGELMLVPDAGHMPMAEYPEVVNPAVVDFVQRVSARA